MSWTLSTQELEVQLSALPEVESADRVAYHMKCDDAINFSPRADNVAADDHEATQEFDGTICIARELRRRRHVAADDHEATQ
jgi:hypothetical protein